MKPIKENKKAYELGIEDARRGRSLEDNPFKRMSRLSLSTWWEAGYLKAKGNENTN